MNRTEYLNMSAILHTPWWSMKSALNTFARPELAGDTKNSLADVVAQLNGRFLICSRRNCPRKL